MIEVDSVRRNFSIGHYEPSYLGSHHPLAGHLGVPQLDSRTLIHWNQDPAPSQGTGSTVGAKSDEEDDDEDEEDRPFTPPPPRERLSYTRYQLELLNAIYIEVRYPNSTQKQLIAKRVGITREQVKIWFQNRRRKDVVGTSGKSKSCDTSTSSTSSTGSKDSEQQPSPVAVDGNESSSSDDISSNSSKDAEESVVPELVMKSVIGELLKFVNDPLKGKKNKKKSKSRKQKEKEKVKKGLSTTLLAGSYDMVSPPNQITPSAFFDKLKNGFNHSKGSSAFANPRDHQKPSHMNSLSTTSDITSATVSANSGINVSTHSNSNQVHYPFQGQQGHFLQNRFNGGLQSQTGALNCDIPVLSDLLSYKSCLEARHKEIMSSAIHSQQKPSTLPSTPAQRPESESKQYHHNSMNNFNSGRPLNGIYPFPFLADQPMLLSSLRHPDQILRPSPQYPMPHFGDDPFQPLLITSLGNPYFAPPASSWTGSSRPNPSVYTQL